MAKDRFGPLVFSIDLFAHLKVTHKNPLQFERHIVGNISLISTLLLLCFSLEH